MVRNIIKIDEDKCVGCGLCAKACHDGAIAMEDGKAKLLREDYCDGLGNCLPVCPTGAITFEEREAKAFDKPITVASATHAGGCPGSMARSIDKPSATPKATQATTDSMSELRQWPVQIKLAPINASFFNNAHLLIAADCAAYARASFHAEFMRGKVTLIGCPKLDNVDYSEKLTEIIQQNEIKSVTIVRMEVPCCGGLEQAAITALKDSGKFIPWQVVTIGTNGEIVEN